jgi:hypothetical protein
MSFGGFVSEISVKYCSSAFKRVSSILILTCGSFVDDSLCRFLSIVAEEARGRGGAGGGVVNITGEVNIEGDFVIGIVALAIVDSKCCSRVLSNCSSERGISILEPDLLRLNLLSLI